MSARRWEDVKSDDARLRLKRYADAVDGVLADYAPDRPSASDIAESVIPIANDEQEILRALLGGVRAAVWADVVAMLNDRAQMWEDDNRPVLAKECRDLSFAYQAYAKGVGVPSMETLREKKRAAEAKVAGVEAALSNHPKACDKHPDGDPITCGWKRAVIDVQAALEGPRQ